MLLLAFIVICCAFIVWYFWPSSKSLPNYEHFYQESSGIMDAEAKTVLEIAENNDDPNALFRRGNVLEMNMLEGNYRRSDRDVARQALDDYQTVLRDTVYAYRNNETPYNAIEIIEHVENFTIPAIARIPAFANYIPEFIDNTREIRENVIEQRKETAIVKSENKEDFVDNYFEEATEWKSDPQNVHDSAVVRDLKKTVEKLKITYEVEKPAQNCYNDALMFIRSNDIYSESKKVHAKEVLDYIMNMNSKIDAYNTDERTIFALVWQRSDHPLNVNNTHLLKEAIVDALADCWVSTGLPVCATGRTNRLLSALVLLDYDKDLAIAQTTDAYRNEIFDKCNKRIKSIIELNSIGGQYQSVAKNYNGETNEEPDEALENKFKDVLRNEIDDIIEDYESILSAAECQNIKKECYAAVN